MEPSDLGAWLKFFKEMGGDWKQARGWGDAAFASYTLPHDSWYSRELQMAIIMPQTRNDPFYRVMWLDSKDNYAVRIESVERVHLTVKLQHIMQRNGI